MNVKFLFVLSPNNSGSTVIGQYIEAQTGGYLPPFGNFEGQMAPGVRAAMRPDHWDPTKELDWSLIRKEWTALAESKDKELFIECSPPNILRLDAIRPAFDDVASYLFSISSPYPFIASTIYNYERAPLAERQLQKRAQEWIFRAQWMKRNVEKHPDIPLFRYEDFCANPGVINHAMGIKAKPIAGIRGKKNEPVREIVDLTARHLAFLSFSEWDAVNEALGESEALLEFFDYRIVPGQKLIEDACEAPALMHAGLLRRTRWESRSVRSALQPPALLKKRWSKAGGQRKT